MSDLRPFSTALRLTRTALHAAALALGALAQAALVNPLANLARREIHRRLGGYKHRINVVDTLLPARRAEPAKVAVIGGGLAGLSAAYTLSARGYEVTIYEREAHLGGKLGAWTHTDEQGVGWEIEHGFHAFFGSYYNLDRLFTALGLDGSFQQANDYRILTRDGGQLSFQGVEPTPFLNLFHMVWKGVFSASGMLLNPAIRQMDPLLRYDEPRTFAELDHVSYAEFAQRANLPGEMRVMFNTVARAFFARADQMSMAELIKSFHLYYLSNDRGLMFRYATDGYETCVLKPFEAALRAAGVQFKRGHAVSELVRQKNGRLRVDGQPYDQVILATDARGALKLLGGSPLKDEAPATVAGLAAVQPQNRYANLRVWLDRDVRSDLPIFTVTEKVRALDSVTTCHRAQRSQRDWVAANGGAVLELHAYQVPPELSTHEQIRAALLNDLVEYFPELAGYQIRHEDLQVRDDFSAFFVGMHQHRPGVDPGIERLWFAGDWVRLPCPAMLMEGAVTSGLCAANQILRQDGLREEPVYSVPQRSLLAFAR